MQSLLRPLLIIRGWFTASLRRSHVWKTPWVFYNNLFNGFRDETADRNSPDHDLKMSFEDGLINLSRDFNEVILSEAIDGAVFQKLGDDLYKVRKEIDMAVLKLNHGVLSMTSDDCAMTKAPLFYILRCPEWTVETGKQFELIPEHFIHLWAIPTSLDIVSTLKPIRSARGV